MEGWERALKIVYSRLGKKYPGIPPQFKPVCRGCIGGPSLHGTISSTPDQRESWLSWPFLYPHTVQLEVSTTCNYGCCLSRKIRKIRPYFMNLFRVFYNMKEWAGFIRRVHLWGYGEPLIHKDLFWFIRSMRQLSSTVKLILSTNGILLNKSASKALVENRVDHVTISIHGGPGTENMLKYSRYGANYDRVIGNLKELQRLKREKDSSLPVVLLKAVLFDWNDDDETMNRLRSDAQTLGLSAGSGSEDVDGYGWVLDGNVGGGPVSSGKYSMGSDILQSLKNSRELVITA